MRGTQAASDTLQNLLQLGDDEVGLFGLVVDVHEGELGFALPLFKAGGVEDL